MAFKRREKNARASSAVIEQYFVSRNISYVTFNAKAHQEFAEEFKKRDAQVLKQITAQLQVNSAFGGGPERMMMRMTRKKIN